MGGAARAAIACRKTGRRDAAPPTAAMSGAVRTPFSTHSTSFGTRSASFSMRLDAVFGPISTRESSVSNGLDSSWRKKQRFRARAPEKDRPRPLRPPARGATVAPCALRMSIASMVERILSVSIFGKKLHPKSVGARDGPINSPRMCKTAEEVLRYPSADLRSKRNRRASAPLARPLQKTEMLMTSRFPRSPANRCWSRRCLRPTRPSG